MVSATLVAQQFSPARSEPPQIVVGPSYLYNPLDRLRQQFAKLFVSLVLQDHFLRNWFPDHTSKHVFSPNWTHYENSE